MDLNPIDDIVGAAKGVENSVLKRKRQLVKYVANKYTPSGPSIISGQSNRLPRQSKSKGRMVGRKIK